VDLRSRHARPLARYFPEIVEALLALDRSHICLDGELVVVRDGSFDFEALLARLHPAASRVERLRAETPASFVVFDLLADDGDDLREVLFRGRRRRLERALRSASPPLHLTPVTEDAGVAEAWLDRFQDAGIDGVVAKHEDLRYVPGRREMVKVKRERTADCVVAGFRVFADRPLPSSLLLGLYDDEGSLQHIGVASSFPERARAELLERLRPLVVPLAGHPWERGFLLGPGSTARLKGAAASWDPDVREQDWTPVAPELVCEVAYDQLDGHRLRHPARFGRWRPDREPRSCTVDQLDVEPAPLDELLRV
jgi:ATP-dependent DNA ligase